MARYKIFYLLLLTCSFYVASAEDEKKVAEDRISTSLNLKPPDKVILQKSQPYTKDEPSFMSRIASWLFPFGSSEDSVPAEDFHGGPQYLPPPHQSQQGPSCNPCNKAPWIPVASNLGDKTLINFVPPSSSSHFNLNPPVQKLHPVPSSQYGPPVAPSSQYGPPVQNLNPPSSQYGPPVAPSPQYGPPVQNLHPPLSQYGAPVFRPKPEKVHFGFSNPPRGNYNKIEYLRPPLPPPTTHLKPVPQDYSAPLGMLPPPVRGGVYHSIPSRPTDSYGAPVTGINSNYEINQEYLPPIEQLPLSSDDKDNYHLIEPIPFPNLNSYPVLPIHNAQGFRDNNQDNSDVQVIPSINVADFVSSIEHPVNVIQSPLVDLNVKHENPTVDVNSNLHETSDGDSVKPGGFYGGDGRLSDNPIVVDEDTHTAASAVNVTFQANIPQEFRAESINNDLLNLNLIRNKSSFTPPPMDYGDWKPTWGNQGQITTSMVPPGLGPTTWLYPLETSTTTKKPNKQLQIIIPYITNKKPLPFDNNNRAPFPQYYSTLVPIFMPPSSTEQSFWAKFQGEESKKVVATVVTPKPLTSTQVYNINDLLRDTKGFKSNLPFDVISLQNNIDDWTQQEFSKTLDYTVQKSSTNAKFVPSKKIPNEYFTTQPYPETTTVVNGFDHEPAGSDKKEKKFSSPTHDIESNFILSESTTLEDDFSTTTEQVLATDKNIPAPFSAVTVNIKSLWDTNSVTVSPITKEKVYIVTPEPYNYKTSTPLSAWSLAPKIGVRNESTFATPKFLVRVDPENKESREKLINQKTSPLTVVFSEWPHLINNLQTTTTTAKPTSRHPLFGLMDLSAYTPPPNSTVQTFSGHSKVVTVVTPASVAKKSEPID